MKLKKKLGSIIFVATVITSLTTAMVLAEQREDKNNIEYTEGEKVKEEDKKNKEKIIEDSKVIEYTDDDIANVNNKITIETQLD